MRAPVKATPWILLAISVWLLLSQRICAQSLADITRKQREKNKQQAATVNKVLTNEDLSVSSDAEESSADSPKQEKITKPKSGKAAMRQGDQVPSAEEFKAAIRQRKQRIAEIQDRITKLQSTINYVQNNRNIYTNAPEYNEAQKRKEQEVNQLKGILQAEQEELEELQKQARNAGYGSVIYD